MTDAAAIRTAALRAKDFFEKIAPGDVARIDAIADSAGAMLTWDMSYRVKAWRPKETQRIHGATHLRFAADGRIAYHRDYWDAANELYAKLPLVGPVMRFLRKRLA